MSTDLKRQTIDEVRGLVAESGLSATQLALAAGISPSTVWRALDPETPFIPRAKTLEALKQASGRAKRAEGGGRGTKRSVQMETAPDGEVHLSVHAKLPLHVALKVLALVEGAE